MRVWVLSKGVIDQHLWETYAFVCYVVVYHSDFRRCHFRCNAFSLDTPLKYWLMSSFCLKIFVVHCHNYRYQNFSTELTLHFRVDFDVLSNLMLVAALFHWILCYRAMKISNVRLLYYYYSACGHQYHLLLQCNLWKKRMKQWYLLSASYYLIHILYSVDLMEILASLSQSVKDKLMFWWNSQHFKIY